MNIDKILIRAGQVKDVAYSLESALIEADNGNDAIIRATNLFYVLLEQFDFLNKELNALNEHINVCNAIFAVNRVSELKKEIEELKSKINK